MDIRKLQRAIVDGLEDVKAQNILVFNTEHLSPLFERVIVASGSSNRQTKALASSVREAVKGAGFDVMRTEGEENGEWIIVDCGAAVVHVMQPQIRDYYHLEEIWGEKPVNMKLGAVKGLPKASEEAAAPKKAAPKRKASAPSRRSGSAAEALKNEPVALPKTRKEKAEAAAEAAAKKAAPRRAPARKVAAPAKKTAAPAQKAAAPVKKAAAPTKKVVAPVKKAAAPAKKAVAPAKKAAAPVKRAAAPAKQASAPAKKAAAPAKKAAAPAKKAPAAKKATAPAKKAAPKKAAR